MMFSIYLNTINVGLILIFYHIYNHKYNITYYYFSKNYYYYIIIKLILVILYITLITNVRFILTSYINI